MNKEVRAKWISALRSGKYEQGYHYLNAYDKFCCLGVLCEIAVEEGVTIKVNGPYGQGNTVNAYKDGTGLRDGALGDNVCKWAGLKISDSVGFVVFNQSDIDSGLFKGLEEGGAVVPMSTSLAALNDSKLYSFEDIAKIVEEKF